MSSECEQRLKAEITEIFDSKNQEWMTAISSVIDVMYQQFAREESGKEESTADDMSCAA
jgi:hypothetical protein